MLKIQIEDNSPFKESAQAVMAYIESHALSFENDLLLKVGQKIVLELSDDSITPQDFEIDLFRDKLLWRLSHSGKNSEAVCRAVIGKTVKPLVFDATAGLGRESIILQSAGCQVYMFERNPVIWLLLKSAMTHAENNTDILSSLKNGLPHLTSLGSVAEQLSRGEKLPEPEVIYYDPMFPQRTKSALVKKDMRVFHEIVGFDQDTTEYANFLLTVAKHHLVVKRPSNEPPLELNLRRSSFVDGKACRFDCYFCGN
ncbi:class I SAM-dependent methyltransferase [Succinivibrio sp.]|jgi:16S rRNA (guanine1516-N2)-methyltransferase|uniref:class I SAM-dependent methyltransferase n=1 Tax=Succinivibrio sp. TaxID=2053619 RepID=UPI0025FE9F2D|nr:class I SAM-dependent methyltransferase [uncultured Succinivibrio sp.]MBQ3884369.1 class I SAM-dependent methyltransferase [Succinivibrio sp.]